jgi:hypothetical protein
VANQTITLDLDELDYDAVQKAMAKRQALESNFPGSSSCLYPPGRSNRAGTVVAGICRHYSQVLEMTAETTALDVLKSEVTMLTPADRRKLLEWLQQREQPLSEDKF